MKLLAYGIVIVVINGERHMIKDEYEAVVNKHKIRTMNSYIKRKDKEEVKKQEKQTIKIID